MTDAETYPLGDKLDTQALQHHTHGLYVEMPNGREVNSRMVTARM
jgi:hypothetical protein